MGKVTARGMAAMSLAAVVLGFGTTASADIIRGVQDIVTGVVQIPYSTLTGTVSGPPLVGTIIGLLSGTVTSVGLLLRGTLELASSAIAIGIKVAPFVLPFLL